MSKFGRRLLKAAREAQAIARGLVPRRPTRQEVADLGEAVSRGIRRPIILDQDGKPRLMTDREFADYLKNSTADITDK